MVYLQSRRKKFKLVEFRELPENPGFVFLKRGIYEGYKGKRAFLQLFSPFGEQIQYFSEFFSDKEFVKKFDENQQCIVNLAHKLST